MPQQSQEILPAGAAGRYYPADKMMLERDLCLLLESAPLPTFPRPLRAMLVPHGRFMYSGGVAARAFRMMFTETVEAVLVMAPILTEQFDFVSVFPGKALQTPLGNVAVHQTFCRRLAESHADIQLSRHGFQPEEHSLEVQLPFIKWVMHSTPIIPVMVGSQSLQTATRLSDAVQQLVAGRSILVLACSNLSSEVSDLEARAQDRSVMRSIETCDEEQLFQDVERRRVEMSGSVPAYVAMQAAKHLGAKEGKVLLYRNSGDITGRKDQVTGYLSAVFY